MNPDHDRQKKYHVAIIGGGYAGMAAAVTLSAAGIPVTVFETARTLGGRARSVWHKNTQLDNGQHILLGSYHHTLQLIEQVGGNIEQDFLRLPLQLKLHNSFELKAWRLPAPLHLLAGLLCANGLSFSHRLSAAKFMLSLKRSKFTLDYDVSVSELLHFHNQNKNLIRLLWEPICIAALNTPIHIASAKVLLHVLRDSLGSSRSDSDILLPRINFSALFPERAAEYIKHHGGKVLTTCKVDAIVPHGNDIELIIHPSAANHSSHPTIFSHVICAASPVNATRLLKSEPQIACIAEQIAAMQHQPIYTVYLQYPEKIHLPCPMLGLDSCIAQWLFDQGQISGQDGLIAAVISAQGEHQKLTHDQLAKEIVREIYEQFNIAEVPVWQKVIAEKRATFSCVTNLFRPIHTTPLSNVLLAGDYTTGDYPATLEGAVISGIRCAEKITSGIGFS